MKEKERNVKFIVIIVVILLIAVVIGILLWSFVFRPVFYRPSVLQYINSGSVSDETDSSSSNEEGSKKVENRAKFDELQKRNPDIYAWILVPDGKDILFEYPVLQSQERDDYYLDKDIDKNYNFAGSIFSEYANSTDMDDRVTVLYGHNMFDGSMFTKLHKFEDESFFNSHRYFYIYIPGHKFTYEIVSAYEYDDRHLLNTFNFAQDEIFEQYLADIQNPRSISKQVRKKLDHKLTKDDKIVTLSTCNDSDIGRFLVQGVMVKDEPTR